MKAKVLLFTLVVLVSVSLAACAGDTPNSASVNGVSTTGEMVRVAYSVDTRNCSVYVGRMFAPDFEIELNVGPLVYPHLTIYSDGVTVEVTDDAIHISLDKYYWSDINEDPQQPVPVAHGPYARVEIYAPIADCAAAVRSGSITVLVVSK